MTTKFQASGEPRTAGAWSLQRETTRGGKERWRLSRSGLGGATLVMRREELFDLADLVDDECDELEDGAA